MSRQCLDDADMSKATRRTAAQDQPYQGAATLALKRFGTDVGNSHFVLLTFRAQRAGQCMVRQAAISNNSLGKLW
jgi:hypothetical protein